MMTSKQLANTLDEMMKETRRGNLDWRIQIETTDDLDIALKQQLEENGITWTVDECFVEYLCTWRGQDFCMISYENILTHDQQTRSTSLIFLPPMGLRFFDVAQLAPHAIHADAYIVSRVHMLFEQLMTLYKENPLRCQLSVIDPLNN